MISNSINYFSSVYYSYKKKEIKNENIIKKSKLISKIQKEKEKTLNSGYVQSGNKFYKIDENYKKDCENFISRTEKKLSSLEEEIQTNDRNFAIKVVESTVVFALPIGISHASLNKNIEQTVKFFVKKGIKSVSSAMQNSDENLSFTKKVTLELNEHTKKKGINLSIQPLLDTSYSYIPESVSSCISSTYDTLSNFTPLKGSNLQKKGKKFGIKTTNKVIKKVLAAPITGAVSSSSASHGKNESKESFNIAKDTVSKSALKFTSKTLEESIT